MKEPDENTHTSEPEDEENETELSRREGGGLEQTQTALSHVQPSDFSVEPHSSPGEGGSPLEGNADRPEAGAGNSTSIHCTLKSTGAQYTNTPGHISKVSICNGKRALGTINAKTKYSFLSLLLFINQPNF